jgi:hypothetical protein
MEIWLLPFALYDAWKDLGELRDAMNEWADAHGLSDAEVGDWLNFEFKSGFGSFSPGSDPGDYPQDPSGDVA